MREATRANAISSYLTTRLAPQVVVVPRVVSESGFLDLIESDPFFDVNIKASYHFDVSDDFHLELSGGLRNLFNSYQPEFDSGPTRDSDFIYGPVAPRSVFFSLTIGNLSY